MMTEFTYHISGNPKILFADILEALFAGRGNWRRVARGEGASWSDQEVGRIRNKISAKWALITKDYLALKMARSGHIPRTYVLRKGRPTGRNLPGRGDKSKWFLKPVGGWGGKGIKVFNGFFNYARHLTRGKDYVVQREVASPMLFEGRKFDIRTFVALIYTGGKYHCYLYPDGICRLSLAKYAGRRANETADLTNTHVQERVEGYSSEKINKLLSDFDWSAELIPSFLHIVPCTLGKMKEVLGRPKGQTVIEIISFDYIVDTSKRAYLIEINRNIGYGFTRKPPYIVDLYLKAFGDLLDFAYEPLLRGEEIGTPTLWIKAGDPF